MHDIRGDVHLFESTQQNLSGDVHFNRSKKYKTYGIANHSEHNRINSEHYNMK